MLVSFVYYFTVCSNNVSLSYLYVLYKVIRLVFLSRACVKIQTSRFHVGDGDTSGGLSRIFLVITDEVRDILRRHYAFPPQVALIVSDPTI